MVVACLQYRFVSSVSSSVCACALPLVRSKASLVHIFCTGLVLYDDGYFDGYDPTVNPGAGGDCHISLHRNQEK